MKKRIVGTLMALLLAVTVLPPGAISVTSADVTTGLVTTAYAAEHQNHCICGAEHKTIGDHASEVKPETWTGVSSLDEITKDGYYYLTKNVELNSKWAPQDGVVLCLNGHSIEQSGVEAVIRVWATTLTLTDCEPNGVQGKIKHVEYQPGKVHYNHGVRINSGTFNMYGGCITDNTSGYVENSTAYAGYGGGVYVGSGNTTVNGSAVFNMYGGSISGNTVDQGGAGGGVYVQSGRTFNMYGGTISENTASNKGGGVFVESGATFTMSGTASITKNTAGKTDGYGFGGGVYSLGTFNLSGGAITENTANCTNFTNQLGGGVMAAGGKLNLSGNPVVKNNIGKDTDNVRVDGATMEVTAALTEGAEIVLNSLKDPTINPTGKSGEWYMWNETTKTLTAPTGSSGGETGGETTEHKHCVCGDSSCTDSAHADETFQKWESTTSLPVSGKYYLANNVTLASSHVVEDDLVLCLNGKTVTASDSITVTNGKTFTLTDCEPNGNKGVISRSSDTTSGEAGVRMVNGAHFVMYGGTIQNSWIGVEVIYESNGTFTMYGGTITGCKSSGVVVQETSNVSILGGEITGNYTGMTVYGGALTIGGNANITGNTGEGNSARNVNFECQEITPITVRNDFTGSFGVTVWDSVATGTQIINSNGYNGTITCDSWGKVIDASGKLATKTSTNVPVTGVTLDKSTASVEVNKTVQLTAAVTPDNATNQAVTWRSGDETVATVSANGVVTGVKEGTATITVTTVDGNFTATCEVTVTAAQTGHVHVKGERTYDENGHWFKCTGCNEKLDVGAHVYDNDTDTTCNTCGYVRTISGGGETGGDTPTPEAPRYYYSSGSGSTGAGGLSAVQNDPNGKSATDYSGGIYGLLFRTNAALSSFRGVQVDGVTIGAANYSVEGNEVYLKAVYLQTLANGKHTLTVLSGEGDMTAAFTVGGVVSAPKTADAGALAYLGLALSSYVGTALVTRKKKEF